MKKLLLFTFALLISGIIISQTSTQKALFTWMSGPNTLNGSGAYGTKSVPSTTNFPVSRNSGSSWGDNSGNLWTFGGASGGSRLNDLMRYNISTNEWTWISGSNTTNQVGTYGTKGVSSSSNTPGARSGSYTWKDLSGNLWLFGGYGNATTTTAGDLNDLWKFDIITNQWTWISGSNTVNPGAVYGTKGVATSSNVPSGRSGGATWVDNTGNLWLFGGYKFFTGNYSDLWKYDIIANQWTWMSGLNTINGTGAYGTLGVPSTTNIPGSRNAAVGITDANNNFWLFGGAGYAIIGGGSGSGNLNDLWKYNPATNEWTWVSGASIINTTGVYGTKGIPSTSNFPGARYGSIAWTETTNLYFHGGFGVHSVALTGQLNDLWKFNTVTSEWTWISGINGRNAASIYGTKGITSVSSLPGGRSASVSFKDNTGKFWMFSGQDFSTGTNANTSDLWKLEFCNAPIAVNTSVPSNTIICAGNSASLSGSGVGNLSWYSSLTGGTYLGTGSTFSTPTITTTATFYLQDSTCAPGDRTAITVSVLPTPNLAIANLSVCANGSVSLVASGANTYTWSTGSNSTTLTTFPSADETYTLSGTNTSNGCSNTIVRTLTVVPLPTLTVTSNYTICSGKSVLIGASGATTYQWNTGPTSASITVTPATTTNYTVTGFGAGNCSSKQVIPVTVNASPILTLTPTTTTLCAGALMTLSVTGAPSYTWNGGANTNTLQISPTSNTSYTVIGEAVNGCTTAAVKNISTLVSPTVSISGSTVLCFGNVVPLIGSGATTYTWSTGAFTSSIAISPTTTTTYSLTGKNANVCTKTATVLVTVNPLPALVISTNTILCAGNSATLNATGADSYTWSTSSNTSSIVVTPTASTTYSLTGEDLTTGCINTAVKTISVVITPTVTISGGNLPICEGSSVSLNGGGATTYSWSTSQNVANISPSPTVTTTYTLMGANATCINLAMQTVTVNSLPSLIVSTTNTLLCTGQTSTLSVLGATSYTWSDNSNGTDLAVNPAVTTNYSVTGVGANGCSNTSVFTQSVSLCTGIQEANANLNSVLVFPNPNSGEFTIQSQMADVIHITNELGQVIEVVELNQQNNFSYQVNHLQSGIYFLVGKTIKQKVIVSK